MIESDIRRGAYEDRANRDERPASSVGNGGRRDAYAERREPRMGSTASELRSREMGMTGRYDTERRGAGAGWSAASGQQSDAYADDAYHRNDRVADARYVEQGDDQDNSYWTFDEKLGVWVDPDGQPYVEAYAPGEEERYAPYADDEYLAPQAEARLAPRKSRFGMGSAAAGVLVLCLLGGVGYAWKKGGFVGSDLPGLGSPPPVIKASTDPVKIKPAETAAADPQPVQEIFNRPAQPKPVNSERLIAHEEQPVATVPVRSAPAEGAPADKVPAADTGTRAVSTSNITLPPASTDSADAPAGATPQDVRRVKTIKIMPDSSVVTGEADISGGDTRSQTASTAPVGAPVATGGTPQDGLNQVIGTQPAPGGATPSTEGIPSDTAALNQGVADDEGGTTTATPAPVENPPVRAAVPPVRPRNIPAEPARPAQTQVASAEAEPAAPQAAGAGGYIVQVSSQRSQADAQAAFLSLQRKYPSVMGNLKPSIRKVELEGRGTYFRVRVGPWASSSEAAAFCEKLKAAGGDCVIARN